MIEIIPAIDLMNGHCVRLKEGDFSDRTEYSDNPVEVAEKMVGQGYKRLHMVDLDGAKQGRVVHWDVLKHVAQLTNLEIDFSGGIRTSDDINKAFAYGAKFVTLGSIIHSRPEQVQSWLKKYSPEKFILALDVKGDKIAVHGWQETINASIQEWLKNNELWRSSAVMITDVSRDGKMAGPSLDLYQSIITEFPGINLIASGGVRNMEDIHRLQTMRLSGIIVGKAYYEGKIRC